MTNVIVTAVFTPAEGQRDQLVGALQEAIPGVHEEKGCELYAIHDADDCTIVMIEKWTAREDLDAHSIGAPVERLRELTGPFLAGPAVVTTMTPLPAGGDERGIL